MQSQIVSFSVAAGAPATNVSPSGFNPAPFTGFLMLLGVTDPVTGLTALPTLSVSLGGNPPGTPLLPSPIPLNDVNVAFAGPNKRNLLMPPVAIQSGQQVQVNVQGGAGATATGRIWLLMLTADELASYAPLLAG